MRPGDLLMDMSEEPGRHMILFQQIEEAKPTDSLVLVIDESKNCARITTSSIAKKDKLVPVPLSKKKEKPKGESKDAPADSK